MPGHVFSAKDAAWAAADDCTTCSGIPLDAGADAEPETIRARWHQRLDGRFA